MTDGNGTAVDVDLRGVPAHLTVDADGLSGKRFVDFHQIEFLMRPARLLQAQLAGRHRTHAHDLRVDARR
jgi:hypothetical protein